MKNISVSKLDSVPVGDSRIEYVERKGVGHPDSLIDGIVDSISQELSKKYMESYDAILHHNVDKGLIIGGESKVGFGHGTLTRKIEVILTGRAIYKFNNISIDVNDIAIEVARNYLKKNTRFLDLDHDVRFESKIANGSTDLTDLFARGNGAPLANDTSFGIGFAPFTDTERVVLETERYLNSKEYKNVMPAVGEDIKVMGMRDGNRVVLTIAIAFVAQKIPDLDTYIKDKERVKKDVAKFAEKLIGKQVEVHVNTADPVDSDAVYLTKTGLSCEAGDDGSVGRGNRVNGIITPFRHMSLEAASGKNPVNHIGKIYNVLATEVSADIVKQYPAIKECNIAILSQIGHRIDDPLNLNIDLAVEKGGNFENARGKAQYVAEHWLEDLGKFTIDLSLGKYGTF